MTNPTVKINGEFKIIHAGSYIIPLSDAKIEMDFERYKLRFTFPIVDGDGEGDDKKFPIKFKVEDDWLNISVTRGIKASSFGFIKEYHRFFKDDDILAYMSFFVTKKSDDALIFDINVAHKDNKE